MLNGITHAWGEGLMALSSQQLVFLSPEMMVTLTLLFVLGLSLSGSKEKHEVAWWMSLSGLLLSLLTLLVHFVLFFKSGTKAYLVCQGLFRADNAAMVSRFGVLSGALLVLGMGKQWALSHAKPWATEYNALVLSATLGAMLLCGANDLTMAFVALETLGISSYLLVGHVKQQRFSLEAALKYLIYGSVATAFLLLGMALCYGLTGGQTSLAALAPVVQAGGAAAALLPWVGVLLLVGLGFKLSLAPFHMWTPDVYEGAPTPVATFLSVVSKMAGFVLALRLLSPWLGSATAPLMGVLSVVAIASMVVGNTAALKQKSLKRLLAYSTVAQAGYMVMGLALATPQSQGALLFYLLCYLFMNAGAFAAVHAIEQWLGTDAMAAVAGLGKVKPMMVGMFSVCLLALAGIPITSGFFAKFFLFQSVLESGPASGLLALALLLTGLLTSVVGLYYYFNLMRSMVADAPSPEVAAFALQPCACTFKNPLPWVMMVCVAATLTLGFASGVVLPLCQQAGQSLSVPPSPSLAPAFGLE
jgi:NAD(P)H-quinone oxidoreductase subunit 2